MTLPGAMNADVSVVIPCFNRPQMLGEAIASVLAQRDADFELIVVDDGSSAQAAACVEQLLRQARGRTMHPPRLLRIENRGPAAARNAGVRLAAAPFVAFLDSDDLWAPLKLARQLAFMRCMEGSVISQTEEIWMRNGVRVNPAWRHRKRRGNFFRDSLRTCLVSPSAVMMRTERFRELGGFDEAMRAAEDYELWLRILLQHEIELLPEPLVTRRAGHVGQLSATVPAIDRFRIFALLKLLRCELGAERRNAVCDALCEKCAIYGRGLARRGCRAEAIFVAALRQSIDGEWRQMPDCSLKSAIARMRTHLSPTSVDRRNE